MKEKLKELRLVEDKKQREVAETLGITESAYSNYEQGIRQPSYDILKKICKYYKVSADYLLDLEL